VRRLIALDEERLDLEYLALWAPQLKVDGLLRVFLR